jgi:hypothetical protein
MFVDRNVCWLYCTVDPCLFLYLRCVFFPVSSPEENYYVVSLDARLIEPYVCSLAESRTAAAPPGY